MDPRCKVCNIRILPNDEKNLKTLLGFKLSVHAVGKYILEVECHFCGYKNLLLREGLTEEQFNTMIK